MKWLKYPQSFNFIILPMRLYIDTNFLVGCIIDKKNDEKRINELNKKKMLDSHYDIIIPQLVVGEAFVQIIKKTKMKEHERKICEFLALLKVLTNLNENSPPMNREIIHTSLQLRQCDNPEFEGLEMDYCDALITSMALNDPENCILFTSDKRIHDSPLVNERIRDRLNNDDVRINIVAEM